MICCILMNINRYYIWSQNAIIQSILMSNTFRCNIYQYKLHKMYFLILKESQTSHKTSFFNLCLMSCDLFADYFKILHHYYVSAKCIVCLWYIFVCFLNVFIYYLHTVYITIKQSIYAAQKLHRKILDL